MAPIGSSQGATGMAKSVWVKKLLGMSQTRRAHVLARSVASKSTRQKFATDVAIAPQFCKASLWLRFPRNRKHITPPDV
jgi:hypothetical protein